MAENWQENWDLDGKLATVEHRDSGLFFSGGTITKTMDPEAYHAHHAVLWTKQVFEGDLRISYEMTRLDSSTYGTTLLYLQAQGIGPEPYVEDISAWSKLREVPNMATYFEKMNLISLSFRENLRCKRYPWKDPQGEWYPGKGLIDPKVEYSQLETGKSYHVKVDKKDAMVTLLLTEKETGRILVNHTWNSAGVSKGIQPAIITQGRIGLRHMSTKQFLYRDFKVEKLL